MNVNELRNDPLFSSLLAVILVIALWLLLMPVMPTIARWTMQRFHLNSSSFIAFAIQQPIPSMYNFDNIVEVIPPDDDETADIDTGAFPGYEDPRRYNHYPARAMTFADTRFAYLRWKKERMYVLVSRYRGRSLQSVYQIESVEDKPMQVRRLASDWIIDP